MIKQIIDVNNVTCIGDFRSRNSKLDTIADRMFGGEKHKIFNKSRKKDIVMMRRKFIRYAYRFDTITQQELADYLGYKDHTTVWRYLKYD